MNIAQTLTSNTIVFGLLPCFVMMAVFWLWQKQKSMVDIMDVGWALSICFIATIMVIFGDANGIRVFLLLTLVWIWGLRLSHHLFFNRFLKGIEDGRYQDLRRMWGSKAQSYFFVFFLSQALLAFILAQTFRPIIQTPQALSPWAAVAAVTIFLVAIIGEGVADRQLKRFRSHPDNRGKICKDGLWRFSRHPNYFFEWLFWFSFIFLAEGSSRWWLALSGPTIMFLLLNFVTGVPPVEKRMLESRGQLFLDYKKQTSRFFPWFEKNKYKN